TGWRWTSLTTTCCDFGPIFSVRMLVKNASRFIWCESVLWSSTMDSGASPPPYRMAGTWPALRRRRLPVRPSAARGSTESSKTVLTFTGWYLEEAAHHSPAEHRKLDSRAGRQLEGRPA